MGGFPEPCPSRSPAALCMSRVFREEGSAPCAASRSGGDSSQSDDGEEGSGHPGVARVRGARELRPGIRSTENSQTLPLSISPSSTMARDFASATRLFCKATIAREAPFYSFAATSGGRTVFDCTCADTPLGDTGPHSRRRACRRPWVGPRGDRPDLTRSRNRAIERESGRRHRGCLACSLVDEEAGEVGVEPGARHVCIGGELDLISCVELQHVRDDRDRVDA